jgi:hypothetical protein
MKAIQQSRRHTRTDGLAFTSSAPHRFVPTRTSQGASNRPKEKRPSFNGRRARVPIRPSKHTLDALARKPVCATMELDHAGRRFPPPCSGEERSKRFARPKATKIFTARPERTVYWPDLSSHGRSAWINSAAVLVMPMPRECRQKQRILRAANSQPYREIAGDTYGIAKPRNFVKNLARRVRGLS